MLLFNYTRAEKNDGPDRFQNISCYYLTVIAYGILAIATDFKTSHVII